MQVVNEDAGSHGKRGYMRFFFHKTFKGDIKSNSVCFVAVYEKNDTKQFAVITPRKSKIS